MYKSVFCLLFLMISLRVFAWDDASDYYRWYYTSVKAYPEGRGSIFLTEEVPPSDNDYVGSYSLKVYNIEDFFDFFNDIMTLYYKPASGYQMVGLYNNNNGIPGDFKMKSIANSLCASAIGLSDEEIGMFIGYDRVTFGGYNFQLGDHTLNCEYSDNNDREYYPTQPNNDFLAVFGKVNIDMAASVDKELVYFYEGSEETTKLSMLMKGWQGLTPTISKPANDIGDLITLSVAKEATLAENYALKDTIVTYYDTVEKETWGLLYEDTNIIGYIPIYNDADGSIIDMLPIIEEIPVYGWTTEYVDTLVTDTIKIDDMDNVVCERAQFKYWTNKKGEKFYTPEIQVKVTDIDTYVCHIDYFLEPKLEDESLYGDVNNDGRVSISDITAIISKKVDKKYLDKTLKMVLAR